MSTVAKRAASRPLGVAAKLVGENINEESVYSKTVVLTGESEVLSTANGRWCLIDSLMLVTRIAGKIIVVLPSNTGDLLGEVQGLCSRLWSREPINVVVDDGLNVIKDADVVLNIGTRTRIPRNSNCTTINSNGWIARISSRGRSISGEVSQTNPLGSLMAASLGVSEVFKRLFDVSEEVAPVLDTVEFSLYNLGVAPRDNGPQLPEEIQLPDTLLVGGGAIGNGLVLLMSQLPVRGRVHIVDKEDYEDENLGTCLLTENTGWVGKPKAKRLAEWLRSNRRLDVTADKALIVDAVVKEPVSNLSIDLVLNGLDDNQARRDSQKLWPAIIVDGSINEVGASVTQQRLSENDMACLKCWFEEEKVDEKIEQSKITSLSIDSLNNIDRLLTDSDIEDASPECHEWLRQSARDGKTICSVISEASLSNRLGVDVEKGFRPSVPFVASAAAALVMAEAIKALTFPDSGVVGLFQIQSLFMGPESSVSIRRRPSPSCSCVAHRSLIERLWNKRGSVGVKNGD